MNEESRPAGTTRLLVTVCNRQRSQRVDTRLLQRLAKGAVHTCLDHSGTEKPVLHDLEAVEISLVSDKKITGLHVRFMNVPGPTDVITFDHGEIVISVDTALRQAREHGQEVDRELFRYIVHGLLHLNGHEDATASGSAGMWKAQEEIVAASWPLVAASSR